MPKGLFEFLLSWLLFPNGLEVFCVKENLFSVLLLGLEKALLVCCCVCCCWFGWFSWFGWLDWFDWDDWENGPKPPLLLVLFPALFAEFILPPPKMPPLWFCDCCCCWLLLLPLKLMPPPVMFPKTDELFELVWANGLVWFCCWLFELLLNIPPK